MTRGPLRRPILTLTALALPLLANGAQATALLDCRPCAGIRTSDPVAAAASWTHGWKPGAESHAFLGWTLDLAAPTPAVEGFSAVRAAGAEAWVTLVFRTPAPLREKNDALKAEIDAAIARTTGLRSGGVVQIVWEPAGATAAFEAAEYGYLLKRAAVALGGAAPGARIATAPLSGDAAELKQLYAEDVAAYVDVVALRPLPLASLDAALATLAELDPGKPAVVDGEPYPAPAAGALARAAEQAAHGVAATLFDGSADADLGPLKAIADEFQGDLSFDGTSSPAGSWAFVRGSDLALRVVAPAGAIQFPDPTLTRVETRDALTGKVVPLGGRRVGQAVEVRVPGSQPYALLRLERTAPEGLDQVKEAVTVSDSSGPSVEEILRRLQEFEDAQSRRIDHYTATNSTNLQFRVSAGVQTIEATFRGPYFYQRDKPADWVWQEFLINGVRWRGKDIPEIPLLQPEKAAAMPLEVHFTKEYRYSLRGSDTVDGRDCWLIDFAPDVEPREGFTLYRGSVCVDKKVFARVRTKAVQLGLKGDVLSNEETLFYTPIGAGGQPAAWGDAIARPAGDPAAFVLPLHMVRQELLSVLNATTLVERDTKLEQVLINGSGFDDARTQALASDFTMVRDTDQGLRYLEKTKTGERVVKEGFDKNRLFALGGVFYEKSLDYPLPLAGINYFSFDFKNSGQQFNLFFAGVLANASIAQPRLFGTRWDLGASAFGIAIPLEDKQFRNGEESTGEALKTLPATASVKVGHPLGNFVKAGFAYDVLYVHYTDAKDTAPAFVLPVDHFTHSLSANVKFTRAGYQLSTEAGYSRRSKWEAWGLPGSGDFDKSQTDYWRWRAALSKNWSFSGFKRFGAELDYVGGRDLDRFSKYEFGYFGSSRIHGYRSNRVRAEQAYLAHLDYGVGIGDVFRVDLIGDAALATDKLAGLDNKFLAGAGLSGSFMGPWQTLVNLDLGVPVAGPEDGFTIYLVFLKLFK